MRKIDMWENSIAPVICPDYRYFLNKFKANLLTLRADCITIIVH